MANPNKFTAKEVLNKVLLDSSGNAVTANSVTSQEALNSVLDTTNNRLNMSLAGGTISGDVTISGDLTVNGSATNSYDEIVNGDLHIKSDSGNSATAFLVEKNDGTDVFVVDTTNSRVGIGVSSPESNLSFEPALVTASTEGIKFQNAGDTNDAIIQPWRFASGMGMVLGSNFFLNTSGAVARFKDADESVAILLDPRGTLDVYTGASGVDATSKLSIANNGSTTISSSVNGNPVTSGTTQTNLALRVKGSATNVLDIGQQSASPYGLWMQACDSTSLGTEYPLLLNPNGGNIGIGISTPTETLSIFGGVGSPATSGTGANGNLAVESSNGNSLYIGSYSANPYGVWLQASNYTDQSLAYPLVLNPNGGNVGIGTASPNVKNHIFGGSASQENILLKVQSNAVTNDGSLSTSILLTNSTAVDSTHGAKIQAIRTGSGTDDLVFHTFNSSLIEAMRIDSSQNAIFAEKIAVGGSHTPTSHLHIENASSPTVRIKDTTNNVLLLAFAQNSDAGFGTYSSHPMKFYSNSTLALTLGTDQSATFSNDVSLNSALTLGVSGSTNGKINTPESMYFNIDSDNSQTDTEFVFGKNRSSDSGGSELMRLTESGMLGINDNNPSHPLSVNGAVTVYGQNTVHDVSAMVLGQESSSKSQIRVYGGDGTTQGSLEIVTSASDGVPTTTVMLLDSNSRISLSNNDSGTSNTVFGKLAGNALASGGQHNLCIGEESGHDITTGDNNVSVGSFSNDKVSTNGDNTAIGYEAHRGDGGQNTVVGSYAVDHESGQADSIVAVGHQAMRGDLTSGADGAVAVGAFALNALTSGAKNIAIGYNASASMTSGNSNIAIGYEAFDGAATGETGNIAIGQDAMSSAVEGASGTVDNNIAIGSNALYGGTMSSTNALKENIAIGKNAMGNTGTNPQTGTVAIGHQALEALTSGARNTAVGYQSMDGLTVGEDNVSFGYGALGGASTASENKRNVAIGSSAMSGTNAGAAQNIAIGYAALDNNLSATADNNTAIGFDALGALDDGNSNVAVGNFAGDTIEDGIENTLIGYGARTDDASAINQIVIGRAANGQGDNIAVIGNTSITDVYMAQDKEATVHCGAVTVTSGNISLNKSSANQYILKNTGGDLRLKHEGTAAGDDIMIEVNDGGSQHTFAKGGHLQINGAGVQDTGNPGWTFVAGNANQGSVLEHACGDAGEDIAIFRTTGGIAGKITTSGTSTAFTTSSDYRLKENEVVMPDALTRLGKLKPYRFNWKSDKDTTVDGFFAHEVAEVVPEAIVGLKDAVDEKGEINPQGIDQSKLVPLLVKAVQELSARVEELEGK